jgi:hypothetical protein
MGSDTPKIIKDTRLWKMSRESFMSTGILKKIIEICVDKRQLRTYVV